MNETSPSVLPVTSYRHPGGLEVRFKRITIVISARKSSSSKVNVKKGPFEKFCSDRVCH